MVETRSQNFIGFITPRQSFAVEFVVLKHFRGESLHVEPSWCLDVVVYMLKCAFC